MSEHDRDDDSPETLRVFFNPFAFTVEQNNEFIRLGYEPVPMRIPDTRRLLKRHDETRCGVTVPPVYQAPSNGDGDPNAWFKQARCVDVPTEVFFPGQGDSTAPARAICAKCPVRHPCLEYALSERIKHGIFGGLSERERRKIRAGSKRLKCIECGDWFDAGKGGGTLRKTCSDACMVKRRRRSQFESSIRKRYIS